MERSDQFDIATTMHMANYVSRRLTIVCLIFKIRTFFITTFFAWLFVRICILPICGKLQARKSSGHIYVYLLYRLSLCDFFYWILQLFRQCAICWTVPTGWYVLNCSDNVIFFELFRQCDLFWTVPTLWYFFNCSDSVIFFELFRQCDLFWTVPTVSYFLNCSDSGKYLLSFILSLSKVHYCALFTLIRMLLSLIQIGIQKIYCSSLCFLFIVLSTIFVFLSLFFIWSLCCLSLLKKSLKTPKG